VQRRRRRFAFGANFVFKEPIVAMTDNEAFLKREFDAEEGSFLLALRCDLEWDRAKFRCVVAEMRRYAESHCLDAAIEKWAAEGFWRFEHFIESWSTQDHFPRPLPTEYYAAAHERLHDLAFWFFTGCCPREGGLPPSDGHEAELAP
jgi:hypothetical protein